MTKPPAPPPAAQTREPGWYWLTPVNTGESPRVLHWDGYYWRHGNPFGDRVVFAFNDAEIGPRIPTPAERPGDAALAERLRALIADVTIYETAPKDYEMDNGEAGVLIEWEPLFQLAEFMRTHGALSPAPRDGGWLPIKSAPDADHPEHVLVWAPWPKGAHVVLPDGDWWRYRQKQGEKTWTHWRPLPAPPTEDGR